jgi:predicted outer membrane repeat protein
MTDVNCSEAGGPQGTSGIRCRLRDSRVRTGTIAALLFVCALAAAGCGSAHGTGSPTTVKKSATTSTTAPEVTTPTITLDGKQFPVPTEGGTHPISSYRDTGQQVILTTKGFLPAMLFAVKEQPVVFTNLTPHTVKITFEVTAGEPPATLAPGQSMSFLPKALQFRYSSSTHDGGAVFVGAFT